MFLKSIDRKSSSIATVSWNINIIHNSVGKLQFSEPAEKSPRGRDFRTAQRPDFDFMIHLLYKGFGHSCQKISQNKGSWRRCSLLSAENQ